MSAYTYYVTFLDGFEKTTHTLFKDIRSYPNEIELNQYLWACWQNRIVRDGSITFVHREHDGTADIGWIWSNYHAELIRVF